MSLTKKDVEKKLNSYKEFFGLESLNDSSRASYSYGSPTVAEIVREKHQDLAELLENYQNSIKNGNEKILSPEETEAIKLFDELVAKLKRMDTSAENLDIYPILENTSEILREITGLNNLWDSDFDEGDYDLLSVDQYLMELYDMPDYVFMPVDINSKNNLLFLKEYVLKDSFDPDNPDRYDLSFGGSSDLAEDTFKRRCKAEEKSKSKIDGLDFTTLNIEEFAKQQGWERSEEIHNVVEDITNLISEDEFYGYLNDQYNNLKDAIIDSLVELLRTKI